MDGAKEDLLDMFIVHTTEEVQVSKSCWALDLFGYFVTKDKIARKLTLIMTAYC